MTKVLHVKANERTHQKVPYPDTLEGWQALVGGYIEVVAVHAKRAFVVNEDGRALDLPFNETASVLAGRPLVGDVVMLEGEALKRWRDGR